VPGGLFELRKDEITGWWVAVVVDRAYDPSRFARPAKQLLDDGTWCQNCREPVGGGVRLRVLRPHAFRVAGTERQAREQPAAEPQPGLGLVGDVGSWQTIVAPPEHHRPLADEPESIVIEMLSLARQFIADARRAGDTAYVQVVQNWGRQAGALTNHLALDLYDLPQIPHRVGEELGGAARYLIREGMCPYCRLVRDEVAGGERLVFEDAGAIAFAPYAARSPFELWVVPRQHQADYGLATDAELTSAAETLRKVLRLLDALERPPYNLVLHTAPLRERVDDTYHWHWEIHPRLREIAGLELGTGLPVNPVSPETAVEELRASAGLGRAEWPS
jgi:UDPglucose--hexose-1-phosphate uridylyltransferase